MKPKKSTFFSALYPDVYPTRVNPCRCASSSAKRSPSSALPREWRYTEWAPKQEKEQNLEEKKEPLRVKTPPKKVFWGGFKG